MYGFLQEKCNDELKKKKEQRRWHDEKAVLPYLGLGHSVLAQFSVLSQVK